MDRTLTSNLRQVWWGMVAFSAATLSFTLIFAYVLPLTAGRMSQRSVALMDRLPHWAFLAKHRSPALDDPHSVAAIILLGAGLGLAACLFGVIATWGRTDRRIRRWILGVSIACMFLTVLAPPTMNTNPYNYMMRARVAAAHDANPYVTPADEFPNDPFMDFANQAYTDTAGGKLPGWMVWNVAVAWVAQGDVALNLVLLRFLLFLMGVGCLFLLNAICLRTCPEHALAALVLWGWNPIMIANIQSRTDTVMVFYLLLGMWLLTRGHRRWAVVPLTLSVFVKIFTVPFLVVAILADARAKRWREIGVAVVVCLATAVAVWLPFQEGLDGSLAARYLGLANQTDGSAGTSTSRLLLQIAFAGLVFAVGWTRRDLGRNLYLGWAIVSLYFSLFFAKFASSDYLLTLLAVTAPVMSVPILMLAGALCVSFFLFDLWYLVGSSSFVLPDLFPFSPRAVFLLPVAALPLVALLIKVRRRFGRTASR
ncbi:MAG: hypothetical protein DHS20C21_03670 [Gemmatimonadota bacterium]|nr:MAG: hypothetical protein DHS20C21_03670 [Gemmatimonadota bacterium]